MQDKLIEAAKHVVDNAGIHSLSGCYVIPLTALENLKAAVRAHDAGTDEELRKAIHILRTTPITPEHGFECGTECGVAFSTGFGHAIKILEKASASHAAESTAQLDAEDPAEPVEDVVSRMCELMGGCACEHCIKRMTAALAVANQVRDDQWEATVKTQYYSADVIGFPAYIQAIKARLAPKPSPDPIEEVIATAICNECGARVGKRELHLKWHAALFPKTGGAK